MTRGTTNLVLLRKQATSTGGTGVTIHMSSVPVHIKFSNQTGGGWGVVIFWTRKHGGLNLFINTPIDRRAACIRTFDAGGAGAVVEDGQLSEGLAWTHSTQHSVFLLHLKLTLCNKDTSL